MFFAFVILNLDAFVPPYRLSRVELSFIRHHGSTKLYLQDILRCFYALEIINLKDFISV